jgi:23S rRNA pseudouridine1911/1915/1917 synthase
MRLDQFLVARDLSQTPAAGLSRSQLKRLIDEGHVRVGGAEAKPSRKLRAGEEVELEVPPAAPTELIAENIPLVVLFEDAHLIAIDKPAGLVVHPAAGHASGTLVNALLHHCLERGTGLAGVGGELRPGIVHRLDRDTTGVMVCTKDDATHAAMAALFKKKDLLRLYRAIVAPAPREGSGTISTLYGRHPTDRKRFTSRVKVGKRAVTHYRVLQRFGGDAAALVECRLETGRTHQIRVHMAEHGHPVLGDPVYGRAPSDPRLRALAARLGRQALHAATLRFVHPATGAVVDLESPMPPDMQSTLRELGTVLR